MTNKQKAKIKQEVENLNSPPYQALRWNGNELIGKRKGEANWQVVLSSKQTKEIAPHV